MANKIKLTMQTGYIRKVWDEIPLEKAEDYLIRMGFVETRSFNRKGGIRIGIYHRIDGGNLSPTVYRMERRLY